MDPNETQEQQQTQEIDEAALAAQAAEGGAPEGSTEQTTTEDAGAAQAAPAPKVEEETEEVKAKKEERRRTFQSRVDNLTREKYEAIEREKVALDRAEFFKKKYEEVAKPVQREQFATEEDYEAEASRRRIRAEAIAVQAEDAFEDLSRIRATGSTAAVSAYQARVAEFMIECPDWHEKVSTLVTTKAMEDAIVDSPKGAEISYYLALHPGEAARIARLSPQAQDREIVRLESRDLFGTTESKTQKTTAPPPIKPLAAVSKAPLSAEDEYQAWASKRNAKNPYGA